MPPHTTIADRRTGRPCAETDTPHFGSTQMYRTLETRLSKTDFVENRVLKPALIAQRIGRSRNTVYRWISTNKITPKGARQLVKASSDASGELTMTDLLPFILA